MKGFLSNMDRSSPYYMELKHAWELTQTIAWQEYLKPLLERKASDPYRKGIHGLDDAFEVTRHHAEIDFARSILSAIERKAREFVGLSSAYRA